MTNKKTLLTQEGQVALFVALIFQVLFLFFAMVINIGLVVHHKINLQNSLDLAAYYAASKQAENLNAIAHINYQIRQSWKLMAWRYRMLGSAGDFEVHPYKKPLKAFLKSPLPDAIPDPKSNELNFYEAPTFCITYVPFKPMPAGENTCKDLKKFSGITLFKPPKVIAGFLGFTGQVQKVSEDALKKIQTRCKVFGSLNMIYLAKFAASFNSDQRDRQAVIAAISRNMSANKNNFMDLDGEGVADGAQKTFLKNLTSANRDGFKSFELYNPLASEDCNASGVAEEKKHLPPKWLKQVKIFPGYTYLDTECGQKINVHPKQLPYGPADENNHPFYYHKNDPEIAGLRDSITNLLQLMDQDRANPESVFNYSVGVEKNPWCMSYVGTRATITPKIPFLPMGTISLQAKSFAKPFGGRIGPWYNSGWTRGSPRSDTGELTDPLLPPRFFDAAHVASFYNDIDMLKRLAANFSRFPGDTIGLKSIRAVGQYGRAIYELDPNWKNIQSNGSIEAAPIDPTSAPNFAHWEHLPPGGDGKLDSMDLLAWNTNYGDKSSDMRFLELSGIIPDAFDTTYYSIEPDFYNNYYERITTKFLPKMNFDRQFKPDLGFHKDKEGFNNYSIKDQIRDVLTKNSTQKIHLDLEAGGLSYLLKDWTHLLTGWSESNLEDYALDEKHFGKCEKFPQNAKADGTGIPTPPAIGNCIGGGRTGYSVKFISRDYLKSEDLPLGGKGVAPGGILNPPDEDF